MRCEFWTKSMAMLLLLSTGVVVFPANEPENPMPFQHANAEPTVSLENKAWIEKQATQIKDIQFEEIQRNQPLSETEFFRNINADSDANPPSQLHIFISFSMPSESLKALSRQAQQANGVLVLRGLVENSLKKTLQKILHVFGEKNLSAITIDPIAFKQFNIQTVPAVLVSSAFHQKPVVFEVVYGDVHLKTALQTIVEEGEQAELAHPYLIRLQSQPDETR